ncbi:MAG: hypothetical protein ACYDA0_15045 [Candidatus Dormibacteraceae bacterium]
MTAPLLLQFSVALFTGMVAATLFPPVRRVVPRPIEIALWIVLAVVCVIGVLSITNPQARELTVSAFWGVDQVLTTLVGLIGAGLVGWLGTNRFTIATWLSIGCGVDIMALALLRSYSKGRVWQPRVRLYEWMELPRLTTPVTQPAQVPYAVDQLNRKWAAAMAVASAALVAWFVQFLIWTRDVILPRQARRVARAASAGRVESRARLESLRDSAMQLQFAARGWYAAAGAPAVNGLATRATDAVRTMGSGRSAAELTPGRMADIHTLVSAQSIGSYGSLRVAPTVHAEEEDESGQTGRLAS